MKANPLDGSNQQDLAKTDQVDTLMQLNLHVAAIRVPFNYLSKAIKTSAKAGSTILTYLNWICKKEPTSLLDCFWYTN